MSDIATRYEDIEKRITDAVARSNRSPEEVALLAVSKRQPLERIKAYLDIAAAKNSTVRLGENYVQEWVEKEPELRAHSSLSFRSHLIGPLQSNKAKLAVQHFDLIESLHTEKLARELNKQAAKIGKVQDIFLQINISDDPAKSGFSPDEAKTFFPVLHEQLPALRLCGLMTITKLYDDPEDARPDFRALRLLREELLESASLSSLELSMGMSADFEVAIEEGATLVRVGSALFGARD